MRSRFVPLFLILLFFSTGAIPSSQTPRWSHVSRPITNRNQPLREIARHNNFYFGTAIAADVLRNDPEYREVAAREFNIITPQEEMKMCNVWKARNTWDFSGADEIVAFGVENKMEIRGHALVFRQCIPEWIEKGSFTREEYKALLKEYVQTMVGRYKGKVAVWDVLNETATEIPKWAVWIGEGYEEMALEWAHEIDPDALLFMNDHFIEDMGERSDVVFNQVKNMVERGIPIDGVGIQMHVAPFGSNRPSGRDVAANMKRYNDIGIQVQITEMDVINYNFFPFLIDQQAEVYFEMLSICVKAKNCSAAVVWDFTDKYTWYRSYLKQIWATPLIFDDNIMPKQAYYETAKALNQQKGREDGLKAKHVQSSGYRGSLKSYRLER